MTTRAKKNKVRSPASTAQSPTPSDFHEALDKFQLPGSEALAKAVDNLNKPAGAPTPEHDRLIQNMMPKATPAAPASPPTIPAASDSPPAKTEIDLAIDYLYAAPVWITNAIIYGVGVAFAGTVVWEFARGFLPLAERLRHTIMSIG